MYLHLDEQSHAYNEIAQNAYILKIRDVIVYLWMYSSAFNIECMHLRITSSSNGDLRSICFIFNNA